MAIDSFTELYERAVTDRSDLAPFLTGHLAIEFLLRKLVTIYDPKLGSLADDLGFSALSRLNKQIGTVTERQYEVLIFINKIRNKFAHEIAYELSVEELSELLHKAAGAFTDMTDGISQGIDALKETKKISELEEWTILELFIQIAYDLHAEYGERGGDIETF
jgi:hypothetical protein